MKKTNSDQDAAAFADKHGWPEAIAALARHAHTNGRRGGLAVGTEMVRRAQQHAGPNRRTARTAHEGHA